MNNIQEIKEQILPVKKGAPYIFVSYSSDDEEVVLPDVLELQKRGWNIWLDIHNVDKKQSTWTENAVKAIDNFYCKLVLFYASQTSLISENCYKELSHIDDSQTIENHINRSIPFIAIETEEIKDIKWYQNLIETNLNKSNYSPERINKHAKILGNFLKNYFTTTNEKIRVHSKDTYENTDQYYREIEEGILKDSEENYDIKNLTPEDINILTSQRRKLIQDKLNIPISHTGINDTATLDNMALKEIIVDPVQETLTKLNINEDEFKNLIELENQREKAQKWYEKLKFIILSRLFIYRKPIFIFSIIVLLTTLVIAYIGLDTVSYNTPLDYRLSYIVSQTTMVLAIGIFLMSLVFEINYYTLVFKYHFFNKTIRLLLFVFNIILIISFVFASFTFYRILSNSFFIWF